MIKNNAYAMFLLVLLMVAGCMVSPDGWAGGGINMHRPSFSLKRTSGTNDYVIKFSSAKNVPLTIYDGITAISLYAMPAVGSTTKYVVKDFVPFVDSGIYDCTENLKGCESQIAAIAGKTYTVDVPYDADKYCIFVASLGSYNASNLLTPWPPSGGGRCTGLPPVDCVGDDCDIDEGGDPEPALACYVKTSSIDLAFGNMEMGSASGETASGKINVNCNKVGAKLTMSLKSGGSSIGLSNGMTAALTAGGNSLGSTISASKGDNNITVQGTLKGTEKEGAFSGSGVLVTDYQ